MRAGPHTADRDRLRWRGAGPEVERDWNAWPGAGPCESGSSRSSSAQAPAVPPRQCEPGVDPRAIAWTQSRERCSPRKRGPGRRRTSVSSSPSSTGRGRLFVKNGEYGPLGAPGAAQPMQQKVTGSSSTAVPVGPTTDAEHPSGAAPTLCSSASTSSLPTPLVHPPAGTDPAEVPMQVAAVARLNVVPVHEPVGSSHSHSWQPRPSSID